jgi:hypothetical protein
VQIIFEKRKERPKQINERYKHGPNKIELNIIISNEKGKREEEGKKGDEGEKRRKNY